MAEKAQIYLLRKGAEKNIFRKEEINEKVG